MENKPAWLTRAAQLVQDTHFATEDELIPPEVTPMAGSSELSALERRVTILAENMQAAQSLIASLQYRVQRIEDALALREEAAKASDELFGHPTPAKTPTKNTRRGN